MEEQFFQCPHCWQTVSMLLDSSVSASYIEDCEVCCNPIQVITKFQDGELLQFDTLTIEQ